MPGPPPESNLPGGPSLGPLAQTLALHREPLGTLRRVRAQYGDVFTLRLVSLRPLVVVTDLGEVEPLLQADPATAHAGEARRRVVPMASPRSMFGSDDEQHRAARARLAPVFTAEAVARHREPMTAVAARHAAAWPRRRPFQLLPRTRALVDDVFVRRMLGVTDDDRARKIAAGIGRMLWTPGNPPISLPANGVLGAAATAVFARKKAPLARALGAEIEARRGRPADDDVLGLSLRDEPGVATEAVVDELLALLMAAQEPAAAALTWVLERVARDQRPADDDAVVRETLRLRPAAVAALRRLTAECEVGGHRLPAGVTVMLPIPLLQRDPRAYDAPDEFRPERWRAESPPTAYWPFGGGGRRCVGEFLARAYLACIVPAILGAVRLRPVWPRFERMVLRGTILVPQRGVLMRIA